LQDRIGYLPEERGLYKKMKVGEQLKFFAELKNVKAKDADQRVRSLAVTAQLSDLEKQKEHGAFEGMQQKIQFITAVLHDPDSADT